MAATLTLCSLRSDSYSGRVTTFPVFLKASVKGIEQNLLDSFPSSPPGCESLTEWEYLPPVGPRPTKGFVGLKNAGATCYMNSVIQQLYMILPIRNGILAVEGTGSDVDEDTSGDEKQESEVRQETG